MDEKKFPWMAWYPGTERMDRQSFYAFAMKPTAFRSKHWIIFRNPEYKQDGEKRWDDYLCDWL